MPKHVIAQRKEVTSKENAESIVKRSCTTENGDSPSDADAKQLVVYMGESTIDHVPTEHVRCCGHQVTWLCPIAIIFASAPRRAYQYTCLTWNTVVELCSYLEIEYI